ncbi:MAG: WD40/YVTN/BNR-like repeat-containing protein [Fimbriimonadaceae bacterium]
MLSLLLTVAGLSPASPPRGAATLTAAQSVEPSLYAGLRWRNIGPFRGGRVAAVSGAVGQPGVFYMGMPLGGVWKTTSAGTTWVPIMDSVKTASSVGAIEVAPSDPNVIYVGMGDMITGGGINEGNGVYKSTDAGKTWKHMGLAATKQIPSILVDPHDPNLVMVATQGNVHMKSDERGLYRSTDGGKTWTKTLYVDDQTGIQKIAWAYDNPEVMLATTVRHYNAPGVFRRFGGPPRRPGQPRVATGTSLYKSTDEGLTWKELKDKSLPDLAGRTCVAIAVGTRSQRMFLVGNFGLYRSDNGGDTWRRMDAKDRRVANGQGGYNCGVYVNPKNPDIVYVINTCSYISRDGGNTFTGFKGAPGGDDPQQMWIDPTDGDRLFFGTDQGATISLDGGRNWSSWYNQPTAQVYHISTDNRFPYWVYATQQDSGCVATASRGNLGAITPMDWLPHPGYEFGYIVPDPLNPNITYAGGPAGGIVKVIYPSGQWVNVSPNVNPTDGLRKVGNQPLGFSPTNPHELFAGFQYLMSTTDGGMRWKKLSPDLGYPKGVTPPKPGAPVPARPARPARPAVTPPPTASGATMVDADDGGDGQDADAEPTEQFGPPGAGSIESFSSSSLNGGTIWVGTSNGLIKVTKNHGRSWEDVTIPKLPNPTRADVVGIDASHHDAAEAYVAIDYHVMGDYKPYFFRTRDYGQTWTKIVNGLPTDQPSGSFARVIRADTKRAGLLFAGTESSMYVSFNDGDSWQSLTLNAPNTSYRDIQINGNDLVVGTYGRSFWVLDDISPLRQITPAIAAEPAHLFKPGDAIRVRRNVGGDTPFPPEIPHALNPPQGAIIYYYLGAKPSGYITLNVSDSSGRVVRHMSSAPIPASDDPPPPVPDFWLAKPKPMPTELGTNRINWNLRYDSPPASNHSYEINANPGQTPASPEGPLVLPGVYTVALTVDGKTYTQTVSVKNDPRSPARESDLRAQFNLQVKVYDLAEQAWGGSEEVAALRAEVGAIVKSKPAPEVAKACTAFDAKLAAVGGTTMFGRGFGGFFRRGGPPPPPTFTLVNGTLDRQLGTLDSGDMTPNEPMLKAFEAAEGQLKKVQIAWKALNDKDLVAFNAILTRNNLKALSPPMQAATVLRDSTHDSQRVKGG